MKPGAFLALNVSATYTAVCLVQCSTGSSSPLAATEVFDLVAPGALSDAGHRSELPH